MVIEKDKKLKKKASVDDYGNARRCRICNKIISAEDIEYNNFEYVKSKLSENYFHSSCVKEEIESVRKKHRSQAEKTNKTVRRTSV